MGFLDYSNQTNSNIIPKESFDELTLEVFNTVNTTLCKSLGPLGSHTTILDGSIIDATKDGYSILKNIRFNNRYKRMVYNIIRTVCEIMNNTVGDGTTTAIALSNAIYAEYENRKGTINQLKRLPRDFMKTWDDVVADLIELCDKDISFVGDDIGVIENICRVTSNNNDEIVSNIVDIYKQNTAPVIKLKDSPTNESYVERIDGYIFPCTLYDSVFKNADDLSLTIENFKVLIFSSKINAQMFDKVIMPINNVLRAMGFKLLTIAPAYDDAVIEDSIQHYAAAEKMQRGEHNLIISQYRRGDLEKEQLSDLAIIINAKIITEKDAIEIEQAIAASSEDTFVEKALETVLSTDIVEGEEHFRWNNAIGHVNRGTIFCESNAILQVDKETLLSNDRYTEAVAIAKHSINEIRANESFESSLYSSKLYNATARLGQLELESYVYYIGANSLLQKRIYWDTVDDVVKCVKSAMAHGYVPGCQLNICNATQELIVDNQEELKEHMNDETTNPLKLRIEVLSIIQAAIIQVYMRVLQGPNGDGIIKLIPNWHMANTDEDRVLITQQATALLKETVVESLTRGMVFDIGECDYSNNIITSAETDRMVLTACTDLVKVLINGNQCLFLDADLNSGHQENFEVSL